MIEIKDYLDVQLNAMVQDAGSLIQDLRDSNKKPILRASMDATHSGRLTNLRVYPGKFMKAAVGDWLNPIGKPVLKHHNDEADPIGRVTSAEYVQLRSGDAFEKDFLNPGNDLGSGFIRLGVNIMDHDSIDKIVDGRFKNVSTRQTIAYMLCSVCGDKFEYDSGCDHTPGKEYSIDNSENKYQCYGITGPLSYKEVSLVTLPGDTTAEITEAVFDSEGLYSLICKDKSLAYINELFLISGDKEVNLMANAIKSRVTADDRKKLTGKTIIAVSPKFDVTKLQSLANEDKSMITKTKNTDVSAASVDTEKPASVDVTGTKKEDVVVPEGTDKSNKAGDTGALSDIAAKASIEALTKSLTDAKTSLVEKESENDRLKAILKDKETELERVRTSEATTLVDLKASYATNLLNTQILLKKSLVAGVKDAASFTEKLKEYSTRSVDSLKDSIKDLSLELSAEKAAVGVQSVRDAVAEKKVETPVSNFPVADKDKKPAQVPKNKALETFMS